VRLFTRVHSWPDITRYRHQVHSEDLSYRKGDLTSSNVDHDIYSLSQVWGGYITYRTDLAGEILSATQDFIENCQDPRAAMLTTVSLLLKGLDEFFAVFLFYDGTNPPAGLFDRFLNIPHINNQLKSQSYTALVCIPCKVFLSMCLLMHIAHGKCGLW
jgi:hypothetical protein